MTAPALPRDPAPHSAGHRVSAFFYRHRWVKVTLLLTPPLLWFGVFYLGALASLLWQCF
jgi:putative spermidine/putrescine transport system permease protein